MADVWAAARAQISEQEQRSAALALALAQEKDALAAVEAATKALKDEKAAVVKDLMQLEQRRDAARSEAAKLAEQARWDERGATREEEAAAVLTRQLALYAASHEEVARQMEAERQRFQAHLTGQRRQLVAMQRLLAGEGDTAAEDMQA
eukprot:scaffold12.g8155.t1